MVSAIKMCHAFQSMVDSNKLRKLAQSLLGTSKELRKQADELTRRAEELDKAIQKTQPSRQQSSSK
jgi:Sec-independent protein translocase protein TatA